MSKQNHEEKKRTRRIFLPLSFLVLIGFTIALLIMMIFFLAPIIFLYLENMIWYGDIPPYILLLLFIGALMIVIFLLFYALRMNERFKQRHYSHLSLMDEKELSTNMSMHGKYNDSDRSYLEQRIAQLSDQLLSSQQRWEDVNHLILSLHEKNTLSNGIISSQAFLERFNIDPNDIDICKRLVFVLTPFHDDNLSDYNHIRHICDTLQLRAMRGDEENIKGDIISHIVKCIAEARIVVANISGRNPNVFYELGIAHSMNKPTILISRTESDIPFDLKNRFVIIYRNENELKQRLSAALLQAMAD